MIEAQLERARQLVLQQRYADAETELHRILAQDPNYAEALALLSICYAENGKSAEAITIVQQAIRQEPDNDYLLYLLASFQFKTSQLAAAEKTIRSAIAYSPAHADYFGLLAAINLNQKSWTEALQHANQGLANDPDNLQCLNIRSTALYKLDKKDEAYATIQEALSKDPENELTHANLGWSLLEKNDHKKALEHFRESLKINPNYDYAKAGLVEALKARYWFYRVFLKYAFWMSNFKSKGQWFVILGLYFGIKILGGIAESNPTLGMFIYPVIYLYIAFAISTWIIGPLSNLFLRLNVYGRYALTEDEITSSNFVGVAFVIGLIGFAANLLLGGFIYFVVGIFGFGMMIACASMLNPPKPTNRNILIGYTIGLGLVGVAAIVQQVGVEQPGLLFTVLMFGILAYQWIANALVIR